MLDIAPQSPSAETDGGLRKEVLLTFEQASRQPGKDKGRTADKAVVAEISSKGLPGYFRKSFQGLKEQMVKGDTNPLTDNVAFVVDVQVTMVGGEPKAYLVTNVHDVLNLGSD